MTRQAKRRRAVVVVRIDDRKWVGDNLSDSPNGMRCPPWLYPLRPRLIPRGEIVRLLEDALRGNAVLESAADTPSKFIAEVPSDHTDDLSVTCPNGVKYGIFQ